MIAGNYSPDDHNLSAGSLGCGNDLVEAFIIAEIIPAWIETGESLRYPVSRGCCDGAAAVKANLRFRISIKLRM